MKRPIGRKLVFSYLLIIVITLTVSGSLFYAMVRYYMISEAKASLKAEATNLVKLLGPQENLDTNPLKRRLVSQIALSMVDSDYFVVQRNQVVLSSSEDILVGSHSPVPLQNVFQERKSSDGTATVNDKEIVYVALPAAAGQQSLVLFTELEQIHNITRAIVNVLARGFLITVAIMAVIALVMMRSLLRPLKSLRAAVGRLEKRDFTPPEIIKTGDEFEELSAAFRQMTLALKRYDEGQRRFLQNASHELKTPLMAIQGYAEGIRDGIFTGEETDRVLDVVSAESIRLKKLVDELIYLSKLETLHEIYQPIPLDVKQLVEESMIRVESLAIQKGVTMSVEGETASLLRVDPDKMMQALINLLANGIRHAKTTLKIRLVEAEGSIRLLVEDDGSGFKEEEKARIFERFFRGDTGDTGLGLAITRAIIEKSGGTIHADNSKTGGAVFTIQFTDPVVVKGQ